MKLILSSEQFFAEKVEEALTQRQVQVSNPARTYLVELLNNFISVDKLFEFDEKVGKKRQEALAILYLKALNSPTAVKVELLKKLGDTSLYVSGFFGDSLNRKVVDVDYYVEMGETAYHQLATEVSDEKQSEVFREYAKKFVDFVDVLTLISQESQIQSNEDLLKLYNRYITTGSPLAEKQLLDHGVLNAELKKVKGFKQ